jgi:hypothetical protein
LKLPFVLVMLSLLLVPGHSAQASPTAAEIQSALKNTASIQAKPPKVPPVDVLNLLKLSAGQRFALTDGEGVLLLDISPSEQNPLGSLRLDLWGFLGDSPVLHVAEITLSYGKSGVGLVAMRNGFFPNDRAGGGSFFTLKTPVIPLKSIPGQIKNFVTAVVHSSGSRNTLRGTCGVLTLEQDFYAVKWSGHEDGDPNDGQFALIGHPIYGFSGIVIEDHLLVADSLND